MEVLGHSFHGTIESILKLQVVREDMCYGYSDFTMFRPIDSLDTWGIELETPKKLLIREVVTDLTNDCRSRAVNILVYEDQPFALYQYRGRGDNENEVIFNKEVYLKFLRDYMNEYLDQQENIEVADTNHEYTAKNYDFGIYILEDDKITSICKTKLEEYQNKKNKSSSLPKQKDTNNQ